MKVQWTYVLVMFGYIVKCSSPFIVAPFKAWVTFPGSNGPFGTRKPLLMLINACGTCPTPKPKSNPKPKPSPNPNSSKGKCPKNTLKLGVCANVLGNLLGPITIGNPPKKPCCALFKGLVDVEAALCLCTAVKANVLGINLNVPLSLSLLLNVCGKKVPSGFQCP
ncbi:hypothetical protein HAX54_006556 [Datura stramonium]|uniref:Bifunctional inhibitor/plant lipid transfer protein/seed storage helical domain-containing protein n=1 Tax=Datura stramonium TaxID=4076 RepID=A0ABS8RWW5_DATST|nr:hypothetical protein [Datura stramonium]